MEISWLTGRVSAVIEASGALLRGSQHDKAPPQGTTQGVTIEADMHLSLNLFLFLLLGVS